MVISFIFVGNKWGIGEQNMEAVRDVDLRLGTCLEKILALCSEFQVASYVLSPFKKLWPSSTISSVFCVPVIWGLRRRHGCPEIQGLLIYFLLTFLLEDSSWIHLLYSKLYRCSPGSQSCNIQSSSKAHNRDALLFCPGSPSPPLLFLYPLVPSWPHGLHFPMQHSSGCAMLPLHLLHQHLL